MQAERLARGESTEKIMQDYPAAVLSPERTPITRIREYTALLDEEARQQKERIERHSKSADE